MSKYPYIQNTSHCSTAMCELCATMSPCIKIEWRVNMFQGDCEFEYCCYKCAKEKGYKIGKVKGQPKNFIPTTRVEPK